MKMSVKFILVLISIMSLLSSCDFIRDIFPNGKSKLTFKLSSNASLSDSILLSGNDIKWINGTTGEIRFADTMTIQKIRNFHYIKCYLEADSLFKATVTIPSMSAIVNDLVLNLNMNNGHFYFEDGYPSYIDNPGTNSIRIQNKEKRTAAWARFIDQIKKEGRYIEK
jgi:hypothetical protein